MGKQTKKAGSKFGGFWTKYKLYIIEEYLKSYSIALKNQKFRKIYIDAFAGSGKTELKSIVENKGNGIFSFLEEGVDVNDVLSGEEIVDGSALISLKYNFDEYYFVEIDEERINDLKKEISKHYSDKINKVHFLNEDSNKHLKKILDSFGRNDKCVMFLDPYALELHWDVLEAISKHKGIDIWYLFPLSINRLIPKDKNKLDEHNKEIVNNILGTTLWENDLYKKSTIIDLFGEEEKIERVELDEIIKYIENRFNTLFPYVNNNSVILKNDKNSPLFMLTFMMTNNGEKAISLAGKLVRGIVKGAERRYEKSK